MISRAQLVQSVLQELQEAAECFGLEGLTNAALEAKKTLSSFSLPSCRSGEQFQGEMDVDSVALSLYPEDAPKNMLPLACKGKGSRLFEAASVLLWGGPGLSPELRARTVVEMLLNKHYYLKGMIDSKVMLQAVRYSLCSEETPEMTSLPPATLEAIFDVDVKATCFPDSFANVWHLYALASVLQHNIYSIYPMWNLKIRPYFHRLIRPRCCNQPPSTLHIMWSGQLLAGQLLASQVFKPEYFSAVVGLEEVEAEVASPPPPPPVPPAETLELLNRDPQLTYSHLRERYSITKSTFYRWKRQSREHRQKAATRFVAKHFLQSCFQDGNVIPLQRFRQMFPEISRSTYYAWKHELQGISDGAVSKDPMSGTFGEVEELEKLVAEGKKSCPPDPGPTGVFMQGAKSYLEHCISMNTLVPYRCFKRSFPGISRSTYYNWRRKAIKGNPNFKIPPPLPGGSLHPPTGEILQPGKGIPMRKGLAAVQPGSRGLLALKPSLARWQKRLRRAARRQVHSGRLPFCRFRLRYPSLSPSSFWLWKGIAKSRPNSRYSLPSQIPSRGVLGAVGKAEVGEKPAVPTIQKEGPSREDHSLGPYHGTLSGYPVAGGGGSAGGSGSSNGRVFVMDVIATTQFKAQAKLFLQRRFESKTFPSYKEFSAHFPFTARSTYYMWKRALHDGLTLVDA
ncbi:vertnin [Dromiciops gliroides]|uniref:vertnin n=1 Tax=Dromiciops gliroides TaxID=33562 RepID=UPI001CC75066|nr:vertnin [Dromiciops gliroides]